VGLGSKATANSSSALGYRASASGFNSVAVPYQPTLRAAGHSHFSAWRLIRLALDGMTGFTTWPLRAVSVTGFALALLAFGYGGYLSGTKTLTTSESGGEVTRSVTYSSISRSLASRPFSSR